MSNHEEIIIKNVVESLPLGLMVISPRGVIRDVNTAMTEILGFPRESLLGKGWGQLFFDDMERNADFNQVIIDVIHQEEVNLARSVPYAAPDGEQRHVTVISSFLRDEGEMVGIVVLIKDDTEIHNLHEREKDIQNKNIQLQKLRVESLNKISQSVAHQIRNPVMTIGGFANLLLKKNPDGKERLHLEAILDETGKLEHVVTGVSEFASIPQATCCEIPSVVAAENAEKIARRIAEATGQKLEWQANVDPGTIWADHTMLSVAVEAVFQNAFDFSGSDRTSIFFGLDIGESESVCTIKDRGMGIPESNMPYIFDPFYTTKPVGVGIGLAKARRVMVEMRGTVSASSKLGGGTTVTLTLPSNRNEC